MSALLKLYGPYAVGAYFCNYGEPLLNLNTPKLIRQAKEYLIGTALSTSLSVQRFDAEAYVESGLDFMVISIDGATQQVYERYRRNGDLELVFSNVRKLVEAKRKLRKRTPVLSWNFLAFEHNAHEIPLAANRARELGMNEIHEPDCSVAVAPADWPSWTKRTPCAAAQRALGGLAPEPVDDHRRLRQLAVDGTTRRRRPAPRRCGAPRR